MPKISLSAFIAPLLAFALHAAPAEAQQARSFVSNVNGNDANAPNCLRSAPCRTFQTAQDNTLPNGEITVLDPGSYGAVAINKSISIINDGVGEAGVLISGGNTGVTINAAVTDKVSLRGLTIKGIGFGGGNGIVVNTVGSLTVENCAIRNLSGSSTIGFGILFFATLTGSQTSHLAVSNTFVADNDSSGIVVEPFGTGKVYAEIVRSEVYHNGADGIALDDANFAGPIYGMIEGSVSAKNGGTGYFAIAPAAHGPIFMLVTRSVAAGNANAFSAGASSVISVGQSSVFANAVTWNGLTIESYGDNYVRKNLDGDPFAPFAVNRK
jgi:hypothetical protein